MKRGSQEPRVLVAPKPVGFNAADGEDASRFSASFRLVLDPWQDTVACAWMRRTKGDRWCASTWGISVPRQNGKNAVLEAVELYGMVVLGLRFLHTAHEVKTARKAFMRLLSFFENPRQFPQLAELVKEIRKTNGQEAIVLHASGCAGRGIGSEDCTCRGGASIEFVARSKGSGRGFTVDVLVLDEAQDLRDEELEALLPTISAAPSRDPVTIYMGTPPKSAALLEDGKGAPFLRVRNGAILGKSKRVAWVEWSLDVDLDAMDDDEIRALVEDDRNVAETNPALGKRILSETVDGEREQFSPRSFARERLNIWPSTRRLGLGYLDVSKWRRLSIDAAEQEWPLAAIGLDMDPSSGRLWVAPCAFTEAGIHVELLPDDLLANGADAAVQWIYKRARRRLPVVIPADSPATVLAAPLTAKRVKVHLLNGPEQAQASSAVEKAMKDETLSHIDDAVLETCVRESEKQDYGKAGQWRLARTGEFAAAPLYAAAGAHFGAIKWSKKPSASREESARSSRSSTSRASATR